MASINEIEIKSLKEFKGHEGEPLFQGDIYYKGKKLGFWSQDAHGGICDNFGFNEEILNEEVKRFVASDMVEERYKEFAGLEILLSNLVELMEREKQYKKFLKKGLFTTVLITDDYHCFYGACSKSKEDALEEFKDYIEESKKKCFKNKKAKVLVFTDLNDFKINI